MLQDSRLRALKYHPGPMRPSWLQRIVSLASIMAARPNGFLGRLPSTERLRALGKNDPADASRWAEIEV